MLAASVPLSPREAHARRQAASRPASGRKRPGRARSRIRTREIRASTIYSGCGGGRRVAERSSGATSRAVSSAFGENQVGSSGRAPEGVVRP